MKQRWGKASAAVFWTVVAVFFALRLLNPG
jgi:hypothetical protein